MHKEKVDFYHFDTTNQWSVLSPSAAYYKTAMSPFNLTLSLPHQISKIKRIYLKSVEIPIGFTNIRNGNTSNILVMNMSKLFSDESYSFTIVLPDKNYTSMQSLLNDINTAIDNNSTVQKYTFKPQFTVSGQRVSINVDSSITFSFVDSVLSKNILGFSYNFYIFTGTSYQAPSNFNIQYDSYIALNFPRISARSSGTTQQISFKIPCNATANQIYFEAEFQSFSQFIDVTDPHFVLGSLQLTVCDRFGYPIDNNGLDWSFTLAIVQHDTSHQHKVDTISGTTTSQPMVYNYDD